MDGPPRALIVPRRRRRGLKLLRWGLISLIVVLAAVAVVVAIAGHHGASVRATRSDQKQPSTASKAGAAPVPRTVPGVGVQPLGITGTWKLVFHDDFNGNSLNTRAWNTNNGHAGLNDITAHASNVSVSGGHLTLRLASTTSGAEINTTSFALAVGEYAEARLDFAGSGATVYNWPAWWISGPDWPTAGESDIAEGLDGHLTVNYHSPTGAHHQGSVPGSWTGSFHTYGIYRGANYCDVYWDGKLVKRYSTDDNGRPETLLLTLGASNQIVTGKAGQVVVDYVRAWRRA
jgi:beta-glucanase (GH16 family)